MLTIPWEEWGDHPILRRLGYKSDFDGDGTLCLKDFDPAELKDCQAIAIDFSEDDGRTWKSAGFDESINYIDSVGAGWYWLASSHPLDEFNPEYRGMSRAILRATLLN